MSSWAFHGSNFVTRNSCSSSSSSSGSGSCCNSSGEFCVGGVCEGGKGFGFGVLTTRVVGRLSSMTQCGILVYWVRAPRWVIESCMGASF